MELYKIESLLFATEQTSDAKKQSKPQGPVVQSPIKLILD